MNAPQARSRPGSRRWWQPPVVGQQSRSRQPSRENRATAASSRVPACGRVFLRVVRAAGCRRLLFACRGSTGRQAPWRPDPPVRARSGVRRRHHPSDRRTDPWRRPLQPAGRHRFTSLRSHSRLAVRRRLIERRAIRPHACPVRPQSLPDPRRRTTDDCLASTSRSLMPRQKSFFVRPPDRHVLANKTSRPRRAIGRTDRWHRSQLHRLTRTPTEVPS